MSRSPNKYSEIFEAVKLVGMAYLLVGILECKTLIKAVRIASWRASVIPTRSGSTALANAGTADLGRTGQ